jgi:hypothetical protein
MAACRHRMIGSFRQLHLWEPVAWSLLLVGTIDARQSAVPTETGAVHVQMHNVTYHYTDNIAAYIQDLGGRLVPNQPGQLPVFDDQNSFTIEIEAGEIAISPESLANALNSYVFAGNDAPFKDISIGIEKGILKVKGKLHKKGDIGFEMDGQLSVTADGKVALHANKIKALHVPIKGLMDLFGIDIADLIKTGKVQGVQERKDDLILDPEQILPPPHISGRLVAVRLQDARIIQVFGEPRKYAWLSVPAQNYMAYRGNRIRFGKLTMEDTDLILIDMDPSDPFDFYLKYYQRQLMAGYSKTTKDGGLRVFMKDFNKLSPPGRQPSSGGHVSSNNSFFQRSGLDMKRDTGDWCFP